MRPTPRGLAAVAAGAVLIGTGFGFGYPELAVLGSVALLATGYAILYTSRRGHLTVRRAVDPDRVTRGEDCQQSLTVHNGSRLRPVTLLAEDLCGLARVPVPLLRLAPDADTIVEYPVPTLHRGVVEVGPLTVTRLDPLGLVSAARQHGDTARVWVHPRTHPLRAIPVGIAHSLDGRIDRVPHGSITFDTLRQYVIGDELRLVHWRTSARVGELMVREHLDTSLPGLVVLLDDRAVGYPDPVAFEDACEAAASVLVAAVRADLAGNLRLVTGHDAVDAEAHRALGPGGARRADVRPLLDRLAEVQLAGGDRPLDRAARQLRGLRLGDTLIYLTGTGRAADLAHIGALRASYPTIVAGVFTAGTDNLDELPAEVENVHLLAVPDAAAFAAAWDGIGRW